MSTNSSNTLTPANELASKAALHFPNESEAYRVARKKLLAEEIELRRRIEHVAELRRALPPGGEVTTSYRFVSEDGSSQSLEDLFGDKQTLVIYNFMFGPERKTPCPMCTGLMRAWNGQGHAMDARIAFVMMARSPIDRIKSYRREYGLDHLHFCSDPSGDFTADYVGDRDADYPGYHVFTRRDGTLRHFWSGEMSFQTADPGQDPRGAPDPMPLWNILDTTPEGRGSNWYPELEH